jgi:GrpB-like predicted nucleotidyltransferase (UPF0157 family)
MSAREIIIEDYDPRWRERFERERILIFEACDSQPFVSIEHVGSTAMPGLAAKPIIDIMPGIRSLELAAALVVPLARAGYVYVPEYEQPSEIDDGMHERRYFRKDENGRRAVHLHMVEPGSEFWERMLLFRDYLRAHPDAALDYADLKRRLAAEYNRSMLADGLDVNIGYTEHKTAFVTAIEAKARTELAGR